MGEGNGSTRYNRAKRALFAAIDELGYKGWVIVEQDVLVSDIDAPLQSARRNREYPRTLNY